MGLLPAQYAAKGLQICGPRPAASRAEHHPEGRSNLLLGLLTLSLISRRS